MLNDLMCCSRRRSRCPAYHPLSPSAGVLWEGGQGNIDDSSCAKLMVLTGIADQYAFRCWLWWQAWNQAEVIEMPLPD